MKDVSNNLYKNIKKKHYIVKDISKCIVKDISKCIVKDISKCLVYDIDNKYMSIFNHNYKYNEMNNVLKRIENEYHLTLTNKINNKFNNGKLIKYNDISNVNIKKKKININTSINNIDDILNLIDKYPLSNDIEYNINMADIHNIKEPLLRLNSMIGMSVLKQSIVYQLLYYIQELHISKNNNIQDYMHTVIYGPPGTGKTELAKIIGNIFCKLKILPNNKFKKVTRADLIAGYLGQTAIKTRKAIKECLGGVMFIDEAYALGNSLKKDNFSKECIDTLCEALSDNRHNLMVIIAGYEDELNNCFFSYNKGLKSRFTWKFKTDKYDYNDLYNIFNKMVIDIEWELSNNIKPIWFQNKIHNFKYYGRDIENLLTKIKIEHSKRVFCLSNDVKRIINVNDMDNGYKIFIDNNVNVINNDNDILDTLYI